MKRTYSQFCPLAYALERVGERWTGLILRDLAAAPKRYNDLLAGLPGIGSSVLSSRLRSIEDAGLVCRRQVGPPTPAVLYELTPSGRSLFRALLPLAGWGAQFLKEARPRADEQMPGSSVLMSLEATFDPARAEGVDDVYEFHVGDVVVSVAVEDGAITTNDGPAPRPPDVVVTSEWETLYDVAFGELDPDAAVRSGALWAEGDSAAIGRCYRLFGPERLGARPAPVAAASGRRAGKAGRKAAGKAARSAGRGTS